MKDYLAGTRGRERKRRGREQTPTPTHLARSGQTLKGQGTGKAEADGHGKDKRRGGRTEAPEPTYHSETYAYLGTHRTQPTWGGKNAWNRDHRLGELVGEEKWNNTKLNGTQFKPKSSCVVPSNGTVVDQATWAVNSCSMLFKFKGITVGAQYFWFHPKPKRPYLQEEDMPVALKCQMIRSHAIMRTLCHKRPALTFSSASLEQRWKKSEGS